MIVVSNAGPLIALGKLGQLGLLLRLYDRILIPREVYREVVVNGLRLGVPDARASGFPGSPRLDSSGGRYTCPCRFLTGQCLLMPEKWRSSVLGQHRNGRLGSHRQRPCPASCPPGRTSAERDGRSAFGGLPPGPFVFARV